MTPSTEVADLELVAAVRLEDVPPEHLLGRSFLMAAGEDRARLARLARGLVRADRVGLVRVGLEGEAPRLALLRPLHGATAVAVDLLVRSGDEPRMNVGLSCEPAFPEGRLKACALPGLPAAVATPEDLAVDHELAELAGPFEPWKYSAWKGA